MGRRGMSLVELMIVVMLLAIVAMIVVPRTIDATEEGRESALASQIQTLRRQIDLYKLHHGGRGPHLDANGNIDGANFIARMVRRTDAEGNVNDSGPLGPYLSQWPNNPFLSGHAAGEILFGKPARPPHDDQTGWYYSTDADVLSANSATGAEALDPGNGAVDEVSASAEPIE